MHDAAMSTRPWSVLTCRRCAQGGAVRALHDPNETQDVAVSTHTWSEPSRRRPYGPNETRDPVVSTRPWSKLPRGRVGAMSEEEPCELYMAPFGCPLQRCSPVLGLDCRVGTVFEKGPRDPEMSPFGCGVQRCPPARGSGCCVCVIFKEPYELRMTRAPHAAVSARPPFGLSRRHCARGGAVRARHGPARTPHVAESTHCIPSPRLRAAVLALCSTRSHVTSS
jgi:hypothetical protein